MAARATEASKLAKRPRMDPNHFASIGWLLVSLAALCLAFERIDTFIKRRAGTMKEGDRTVGPQPFVVAAETKYVELPAFEEHKEKNTKTHNEIFANMRATEARLNSALKAETDTLHEKINAVAKQNAAQEAKQDLTNQRLIQMDQKLDRLIERK